MSQSISHAGELSIICATLHVTLQCYTIFGGDVSFEIGSFGSFGFENCTQSL